MQEEAKELRFWSEKASEMMRSAQVITKESPAERWGVVKEAHKATTSSSTTREEVAEVEAEMLRSAKEHQEQMDFFRGVLSGEGALTGGDGSDPWRGGITGAAPLAEAGEEGQLTVAVNQDPSPLERDEEKGREEEGSAKEAICSVEERVLLKHQEQEG
ncbi:unnamed protein product [Discosporangium mesarthrocarpum]